MSKISQSVDPRVLRTRQFIRDAFIHLLEETELEKITVNRIAERATINRVTFYLHYRDIQDMLERMADDMINEMKVILEDSLTQPRSEDMDRAEMVRILEHIAANARFYNVVLGSKRIPVFTDRFTKLIFDHISDRAEQRGASLPSSVVNVPKDIAIWYGSSAFIGTIVFWLRNDMPYTPLFLVKQLSVLFKLHQNTRL